MHLMAVLLKLGEDSRSITSAGFAAAPKGQHNEGQSNPSSDNHVHWTSTGKSTPEASGHSTPSEHSSDEAEMPGEYCEMKEHLLLEDEDLESSSPCASLTNSAPYLESPSSEHGTECETIVSLISRPMPLSSVEEGDDEVYGSTDPSPLINPQEHVAFDDSPDLVPAMASCAETCTAGELSNVLAVLEHHLDREQQSSLSGTGSDGATTQPHSPQASSSERRNSWPTALKSVAAEGHTDISQPQQACRSRASQPQATFPLCSQMLRLITW